MDKIEDYTTERHLYCPMHYVLMVERTATKGQQAGKKFWGCPKFPICYQTKDYEEGDNELFLFTKANLEEEWSDEKIGKVLDNFHNGKSESNYNVLKALRLYRMNKKNSWMNKKSPYNLEICPICKSAESIHLILKLGMCGFCNSWERYNKRYETPEHIKLCNERIEREKNEGVVARFLRSLWQ